MYNFNTPTAKLSFDQCFHPTAKIQQTIYSHHYRHLARHKFTTTICTTLRVTTLKLIVAVPAVAVVVAVIFNNTLHRSQAKRIQVMICFQMLYAKIKIIHSQKTVPKFLIIQNIMNSMLISQCTKKWNQPAHLQSKIFKLFSFFFSHLSNSYQNENILIC